MADTIYNIVVVAMMFIVGFIFGFRFHADPLMAALVPVAALLLGLPFSWVAAYIGAVPRGRGRPGVGITWVFPVTL